MKIILLFYIVYSTSAITDLLDAERNNCIKFSNIDPQRVTDMRNGVFDDSDNTEKEYAACMFKKANVISELGVINKDVVKKLMIATESEKVILMKECVIQKDSPQETSYDMYRCLVQKNPASVPGTF